MPKSCLGIDCIFVVDSSRLIIGAVGVGTMIVLHCNSS